MAAIFICQHPTANAIGWRLDGKPLLNSHLDNVSAVTTSVTGSIQNILTIVANPQYNLTEVECVALYFDGSPFMNPGVVTMTIQGL